ncbi:MAG TPA: sigma-70 family RNA polymerase sigma factor [Coriobacteriia bacterium]
MASSREQRFRVLADEATPPIAMYLRRRLYPLSAADLDDLVEEVLLIAWRRLDDIPAGAEVPWLIGVARNVLRNALRKQRRISLLQARLRPPEPDAAAEDYVIADEGVREALSSLNQDDREILFLHFWDGRSAAELAVILAISSNAAGVRLSRALERFRKSFDVLEVE